MVLKVAPFYLHGVTNHDVTFLRAHGGDAD